MYKLCGAESNIKDSFKFSEGYKLSNSEWLWAEEWLEPVHKFKEGSLTVVRSDLVPSTQS